MNSMNQILRDDTFLWGSGHRHVFVCDQINVYKYLVFDLRLHLLEINY